MLYCLKRNKRFSSYVSKLNVIFLFVSVEYTMLHTILGPTLAKCGVTFGQRSVANNGLRLGLRKFTARIPTTTSQQWPNKIIFCWSNSVLKLLSLRWLITDMPNHNFTTGFTIYQQ